MRRLGFVLLTAFLLAVAGVPIGCEWSGGSSNSFNTSRGAGINVNISGFYEGQLGGGKAVETSAGNIRNLTLSQAGNRVQVVDNQGSQYSGSVGVPDVRANVTQGAVLPASTQLMQFQVNWQGTDGISGKEVQFVGVIDVVTVEQVQSTETTSSRTVSRESTSSSETSGTGSRNDSTTVTTEPDGDGSGSNTNIIEDIGDGTNIIGQVAFWVGVTTTNSESSVERGAESSSESGRSTGDESQVETTTVRSFSLTPANTQFRLRGTWVETAGRSGGVNAISTGSGLISATVVSTGAGTAN